MAGRDALLIVRRAGRKEVTNAQIKIPTAFPLSRFSHSHGAQFCESKVQHVLGPKKQNFNKVLEKKIEF